MRKYIHLWIEFPVLKLLFHPALYVWIDIFLIEMLIITKKRNSLFSLPIGVLIIYSETIPSGPSQKAQTTPMKASKRLMALSEKLIQ